MKVSGEAPHPGKAVDHEGELLAPARTRDEVAARHFMRKALKRHGPVETIATNALISYPAAVRELGSEDRRETGAHANTRGRSRTSLPAARTGEAAV